jgi:hypothetical protein
LCTIENRKLARADRRPQPTFAPRRVTDAVNGSFRVDRLSDARLASVLLAGTIREQGFRDFIQGWLIGRRAPCVARRRPPHDVEKSRELPRFGVLLLG